MALEKVTALLTTFFQCPSSQLGYYFQFSFQMRNWGSKSEIVFNHTLSSQVAHWNVTSSVLFPQCHSWENWLCFHWAEEEWLSSPLLKQNSVCRIKCLEFGHWEVSTPLPVSPSILRFFIENKLLLHRSNECMNFFFTSNVKWYTDTTSLGQTYYFTFIITFIITYYFKIIIKITGQMLYVHIFKIPSKRI